MSLIQQYMVSNNTPGSDLTLSPLSGQSLLIKGIYISNTESGYVTLETSKSTVGYFRMDKTIGNQLSPRAMRSTPGGAIVGGTSNILQWMQKYTDFSGYPVGEGETFRVTGTWTANARITVVYEIYNAGDQLPSNPNGSNADTYHVMNFITVSGGVSAGGYQTYNKQITPPQFPAFPGVSDVPSNNTIKLLGIIARAYGKTGAATSDYINTELVKLTRERTVLFDEDKAGLPNYGTVPTAVTTALADRLLSVFGNPSNEGEIAPFMLNVPLLFNAGDTLQVQQQFASGGTVPSLSEDQVAIGFLEEIKVAAGG